MWIFAFILLIFLAAPSFADNWCSGGHGSGGGAMIVTHDGRLVMPDRLKKYFPRGIYADMTVDNIAKAEDHKSKSPTKLTKSNVQTRD